MVTLIGGDLYQWDTGRIVFITPDSGYTVHEVHFTTKKMDYAYVVKTYVENGGTYCAIPNILLQQYQDVICYEVRENDSGEESISTTTFDVVKRNRPVDYVYTEPEKYTYKELENRIKVLEDSLEDVKTASDEAAVLANKAHELAEAAQNTANSFDERLEAMASSMVKSINNVYPDKDGNVKLNVQPGDPSGTSDNIVEF